MVGADCGRPRGAGATHRQALHHAEAARVVGLAHVVVVVVDVECVRHGPPEVLLRLQHAADVLRRLVVQVGSHVQVLLDARRDRRPKRRAQSRAEDASRRVSKRTAECLHANARPLLAQLRENGLH
eukprot:scaffold4879_cov354-Prasinococcus_capsulatus_cf.AAC.4